MENENGERPKETKEGPSQNGSRAPNGSTGAWERNDQYYRYYYGQPYYPQYQPQPQYGGWGWGWHYTPSAAQRSKPKPRRSSKPAVAGALLILAGIIAIFVGGTLGMLMNNSSMFSDMSQWDRDDNGLGAVSGQVIFQNLTPVVNAKVTVVDTAQVGYTNDTGQYRILNVETGWHDIRVEKEGYITMVQSVQVNEGTIWTGLPDLIDTTNADFQLQPGTGEIRIGDPHDGDGDRHDDARGMAFLRSIANFCMATTIIFGAITIIGGYLAIKRRHFPFVIVAGFFGIMSIGAGLSAVLSIIALIILFLSSDEFDKVKNRRKRKKGKKRKGGRYHGHYNQPAPGPSPNYGHAPGQRGPYQQQQYPQYQPYQQRYHQPTLQHPRWIPPGPGQY